MTGATAFDERFDLLRESDQAGDQAIALTRQVAQAVERDFRLALNEDNGGMFVTHVAIAVQRLIDGVALDTPPAVVLAEARALSGEWAYAEKLAASLTTALGKTVPEGEIGYLTLHLARLKQEANG